MRHLILVAALCAAMPNARAADLSTAAPATLGLDQARLDAIGARMAADVRDHVYPGATLVVLRHGKVAYDVTVGERDPQAHAAAAPADIYRIYSMSKPITVVAALMLLEQGRFTLDEPIAKYLPEFREQRVGVADPLAGLRTVPAERPITIQDLMRHSSGITYGFFGSSPVKTAYNEAHLNAGDPDTATFVQRLARLPLAYQPGTTWDYSYGIDVVGRLVEVVSGQSLFEFEKRNILDPLGMADTGFGVPDPARQDRIAEPYADDRNFGVDANFSDPRHPVRFESGGGGMVSTAHDYARFLQMLLNGGTLDGRRYLSTQTVRMMTSDQMGTVQPGPLYLPGAGYRFGLGVAVRAATGVAPFPGDAGDWYWGGGGGTYMWVDPARDMAVVWMMQAPKQRNHVARVLRDMVNAAVVD